MVRENKKEFKAAGGDNKAECRLGRVKPNMRRQSAMGSKVLEPNRNRGENQIAYKPQEPWTAGTVCKTEPNWRNRNRLTLPQ